MKAESKYIEIWAPKWKTNEVYVAKSLIKTGENIIVFTKVKSYENLLFVIDGSKVINECKLYNNNGRMCYIIPLNWFDRREK